MKRSIKNKIFVHFVAIIAVIICVILLMVAWQLHKNKTDQEALLTKDLTEWAFSSVHSYHAITTSLLGNLFEEVKNYGLSVSLDSPIANNIIRQQQESIVEFLQSSTKEDTTDFSLVFNSEGTLQASSAGSRGYKPGDRNLPSRIELYKSLSVAKAINTILKKELNLQASPLESIEREESPTLSGFIRVDQGLLRNLGIDKKRITEKGAIAIVTSKIIRDDFFVPIGIFINGKILDNFDRNFTALLEGTNIGTSLYIDTTEVASTGFTKVLEMHDGSSREISPDEAARIHEKDLPTNMTLSRSKEKYLSTCSSIKDVEQNKIGILCSSLPQRNIKEIQQPFLNHNIETQNTIQRYLFLIGAVMLLIFVIVARIIAAGITKPLESVIKFTNTVGDDGLFLKRLNNPSVDEIGVLGQSIDLMLNKLNSAVQEKETLETQLRHAHKMEAIGTLAGGIAHDFNNLLTIILGYTQLSMSDTPKDSKLANNLKSVLEAGNRAKDLVHQILTFSRQSEIECIPMQLTPLIKEVLKMLRSSLPTTIGINNYFDSKCGVVLADPTQVHQLLMNLCTNALHSMEQSGGTLNVELRHVSVEKGTQQQLALQIPEGEYAELLVSDNGTGIDPSIIEKIFDPYFTTKERGKGTGMGLAISRGIIADYGGTIVVESEPGKGTTFRVYFPVIEWKESKIDNKTEELLRGKERVLFVDDEESLSQMCKDILERLGYSVTVRLNGLEALSTFQNAPDTFDVIVTDQTMPGMTGSALAQKVLQIRPDIPIILCTGYSNAIDERSAKDIGIKEFALKPISQELLVKLVRKVLDE